MPLRAALSRPVLVLVALVLAALLPLTWTAPGAAAERSLTSAPQQLVTHVAVGRPAIEVSWLPPATGGPLVTEYAVLLDGTPVATTPAATTHVTLSAGLVLGRTHRIEVEPRVGAVPGRRAARTQTLYVQPVTPVQAANPTNPLAGTEWGVYLNRTDPAYNGWSRLGQADKDRFALFPMVHKAKFFGGFIPDAQAYAKTREYITTSQMGDPERLTIMTLFRMDPWEGDSSILKRLPTAAEIASYKRFVTEMARAIGDEKVAVVVQPDGFFAKMAYDRWVTKVGRKKALVPAKLLAWTSRALSRLSRTTVYLDMGSEDWSRGNVAPTVTFLRHVGVKHARGFSLNVSHKNYLDREVLFGQQVVQGLAAQGIPGVHFVVDTSDNGNPFSGAEVNGKGRPYTPPGDIKPCASLADLAKAGKLCTALGVPPTTDVDNPAWGLSPEVARTAARLVDAYLWVSRPWLPHQGAGGTTFSTRFGTRLLASWQYSPYFTPTS